MSERLREYLSPGRMPPDSGCQTSVVCGGVARAFPTGQLQSSDDDGELITAVRATVHRDRSGDVFFVLEPYWMAYSTSAATHGSPHPYDREVPLFAYGPGLRRGYLSKTPVTPGTIPVLAAALLGVEPPSGARNPLPADALR